MKKLLRALGIFLLVVIAAGVGGALYVKLALPNVGEPPQLTIQADSSQLARGKYLAHHVAVCMDCHSTRDWTRLSAPLVVGSEGKGGEAFTREMGFPGNYFAPNLTPVHLSGWSDGQLFQAITCGVNKDGRALFPVMPYQNFGKMDPDDIKAIIAYVRTLKPIDNPSIPAPESDFPVNFIINTMPARAEGGKRPDPSDRVAYGKYLTTFASCGDCHTPVDEQGQALPGMEMAGGRSFPVPSGTVRSMNITQDAETGIGQWTRETFIARFKSYADGSAIPEVGKDGFNSIMPWAMYAGMTEDDLGAIYDYLKTVKPIKNKVERFTGKAL